MASGRAGPAACWPHDRGTDPRCRVLARSAAPTRLHSAAVRRQERSGTSDYVVGSGHAEAAYVQYHDGYYYLFWSTGGCCSGASSTYEVHVARSTTVTGTYSAAQIFIESSSDQHGPGQIGIP